MPHASEMPDASDASDAGLALRMIQLLKDEHVLKELKQLLFPQEMANKLDMLTTKLEQLTEHLATKDAKIATIETTINKLETKIDDQEQYSRRANIVIQGIKEDVKGGHRVESAPYPQQGDETQPAVNQRGGGGRRGKLANGAR